MTGRARPRVSRCKEQTCGESIIWCVTDKGKSMPVDVVPVERGNLTLTLQGSRPPLATVTDRRPGQLLHLSHFATCRKKKSRQRKPTKGQAQTARPADQGELFSSSDAR